MESKLSNLIQQVKSVRTYQKRIIPVGSDIVGHIDLIRAIAARDLDFTDPEVGENFESPEMINLFTRLLRFFNGMDGEDDLDKGILLVGAVGTGKTKTMEFISEYLKLTGNPNYFRVVDSRAIVREFAKDKYEGLEKFTFNYQYDQYSNKKSLPANLCFDDLGLEKSESKHYGDTVDVMGEVMADRYKLFSDPPRKLTHATSNLSPESMKENYGDRLTDRFREMFNVIPLTGKSKRK